MDLLKYDDVLTHLEHEKRPKHLLLGNGFSMAYESSIFSYNALSRFITEQDDSELRELFDLVKTKNFEIIMQQLDFVREIIQKWGHDKALLTKVETAQASLKIKLLEAVKEMHPEHVFTIPEDKNSTCAQFLNRYLETGGNIFTTNYDLLLYWVLMRGKLSGRDGFGRDVEDHDGFVDESELEYSELRWGKHKDAQNIHYLHGALPLFDTGIDVVKEEYDGSYLLERIKQRIEKQEYPIFVTAGTGNEKLNHIKHNPYLAFCYDKLCSTGGSLISFGFQFGDMDAHIIEAINIAAKQEKSKRLWSIYIGVYNDADIRHMEKIEKHFKCKVRLFDVKTAHVWR